MRISDWSSDVCSSDLSKREADIAIMLARPRAGPLVTRKLTDYALGLYAARTYCSEYGAPESIPALQRHPLVGYIDEMIRSEEHTSELQSLMRISYAVFCLKKKKTSQKTHKDKTKTQYQT